MNLSFNTQPSPKIYSVITIYDYLNKEFINLNAPYQRQVVWNEKEQSLLISSLVSNLYINPVLVNETRTDATLSWSCIDGKQRLTSVKRFYGNEIPVIIDNIRVYYSDCGKVATSKRRTMTDAERRSLDNKNFSVVVYNGIDYDSEKQIFSVIQNGIALNYTERMSVLDTPFTSFLKILHEQYYIGEVKAKISNKRGNDILLFSRVITIGTSKKPPVVASAIYRFAKKATQEEIDNSSGNVIRICDRLDDIMFARGDQELTIAIAVVNKYINYDTVFIKSKTQEVIEAMWKKYKGVNASTVAAIIKLLNDGKV
jgi:hypothetical protein